MALSMPGKKNEEQTGLYHLQVQNFQEVRNLKKEYERLKTFSSNWTVSFMDPKKLAENGFYYTNTSDVIRCAFCDISMGGWELGDDPEDEHLKLSPECPFINGLECGNLILEDETKDNNGEEEVTSQDEADELGDNNQVEVDTVEFRVTTAPERLGNALLPIELNDHRREPTLEELGILRIVGPVVLHYATFSERLRTFHDWPIPQIQSPVRLAQAGFFFTSYKDHVLCFHCGGGLRNWDLIDDPWVEHARWFSRCSFILLIKGREFVNQILETARNQTTVKGKTFEKKEEATSSTTTLSSSVLTSTSSYDKENKKSKYLNAEENEFKLCRICYESEREVVFLPCGHFVSCTQCAPSLNVCVLCMKPFQATVRAYVA